MFVYLRSRLCLFHVSPLTLIPLMGIQCLRLSLLFVATALMVCVIAFCLALPAMFSFAFAKLQKLTPFHKKNKLESNMEVVV